MASYDASIKIMLLGDKSVEKTSLTIRCISGFFLEDLKLTIGVDFYSKIINIDNKKIKLQIWDFGGEQRFRFLLHQYCKGANGAFFLYDITNRLSLDHLPDWTQIIREHAGDIPIILLGAKAHLKEFRAVSKDEGILAEKKYNLSGFLEVSSKTGQNVENAFEALTRLVLIQPVFCQKCKKEFTFEEFIKHPCYKAGEVLSTGRPSSYIPQTQSSGGTRAGRLDSNVISKFIGAKMDTVRALSELSSKQSYLDLNSQLGTAGRKIQQSAGANIDPQLKGEVQSFLEWIKDNEGLSGYINYYLHQNNTSIISELSKIYTKLRQIFEEPFPISNLPISSCIELLQKIMQNIIKKNSTIKENGFTKESNYDPDSSDQESSSINLLIDNLIATIQKNPSKKVLYLRLFLERFRDISDRDKNTIIQLLKDEVSKKKSDYDDDDKGYFPYPYIFNPPKPPDDFAGAAQVQLRAPLKNKDPEEEIYCQYCGRKLTKEEQLTHSCKKKPE